MFVKFGIDFDAVHNSVRSEHLDRLLANWRLGILTHPAYDDGAFRVLVSQVGRLKQNQREGWEQILGRVTDDRNLYRRSKSKSMFKVGLTSDKNADGRSIPKGQSKYQPLRNSQEPVEWVRLTDVDESKEFQNAQAEMEERAYEFALRSGLLDPVREGESAEIVWNRRLRRYANRSGEIAVIDRYATQATLMRLLGHIDGDSQRASVTVYGSYEKMLYSLDSEATSFENNLKRQNFDNITEVTIYVAPNQYFGHEGRDRFIRLDDYAFTLGHGIEIFGGNTVQVGTTLLPTEPGYVRDIEADLCKKVNKELEENESGKRKAAQNSKIIHIP